jgi:hypothetical protein
VVIGGWLLRAVRGAHGGHRPTHCGRGPGLPKHTETSGRLRPNARCLICHRAQPTVVMRRISLFVRSAQDPERLTRIVLCFVRTLRRECRPGVMALFACFRGALKRGLRCLLSWGFALRSQVGGASVVSSECLDENGNEGFLASSIRHTEEG